MGTAEEDRIIELETALAAASAMANLKMPAMCKINEQLDTLEEERNDLKALLLKAQNYFSDYAQLIAVCRSYKFGLDFAELRTEINKAINGEGIDSIKLKNK